MSTKYRYGSGLRILVTIILIVFWVSLLIFLAPMISSWSSTNESVLQHRTFPFGFTYRTLNQSSTIPDIQFNFTIYYPNGILVVDEPVNITVTVAYIGVQQNISELMLTFENSLMYPVDYNAPYTPTLIFFHNSNLTAEATVTWETEGSYRLDGWIYYTDGSYEQIENTPLVFQVYPKTQLAEIENGNVNVWLSVALFLFALVGSVQLISPLWRKDRTSETTAITGQTRDSEMNEGDDAELQIRIAQLNAKFQGNVAFLIGLVGVAITTLIFGYQAMTEFFPSQTKVIIGIAFWVVAGFFACLAYLFSLNVKKDLQEFKNLKAIRGNERKRNKRFRLAILGKELISIETGDD